MEDLKRMASGWSSSGVQSLAADIMEWAITEIDRLRALEIRQDNLIQELRKKK